MALKVLAARLASETANKDRKDREHLRKDQVGSGMRGDKIRTYRYQDDQVTDHRTGRAWKLKKWIRGEW